MRIIPLVAALVLLGCSLPAAAQEDTETEVPGGQGGLSLSAEANLLSDFRFRGISRSDPDPAVQGSLTASVPGGFYLGGRAATLNETGNLGGAQLDLYAGFGADLGLGTSVDAGIM